MAAEQIWDYIVVGGGLAGTVVASRLKSLKKNSKILIIEAGPKVDDISALNQVGSVNLIRGPYDYDDFTVPQAHLDGRKIQSAAGKGLGGGSLINTCGWTRGSKRDYDDWAELVDDKRWSYDSQLPYFKRSEDFWSKEVNPDQHGHGGAFKIEVPTTTGRVFPLRDAVLSSYESAGIRALPGLDANAGDNVGVGQLAENRRNGARQVSTEYYPLDGVTVLADTTAHMILLEKAENSDEQVATGVLLHDKTVVRGKEIILSAGAYRSPQLLMLSGIGPSDVLSKHGIEQKVNLPEVGKNLADHPMFMASWRLSPEYASSTLDSGNPMFAKPEYLLGQPNNFITAFGVEDKQGLVDATAKDRGALSATSGSPLDPERAFNEFLIIYVNVNPTLPAESKYLTTANIGLLPTARGYVSLGGPGPEDPPIIDPNFLGSEVDRFVWRDALRRITRLMIGGESALSRGIVEAEVPPPGLAPLSLEITDDELDARVRAAAIGTYHAMGSCSMGKVVDNQLRVKGVGNLRVVDASVIPVAITAHIQAAVYALADQAADVIASATQ